MIIVVATTRATVAFQFHYTVVRVTGGHNEIFITEDPEHQVTKQIKIIGPDSAKIICCIGFNSVN